MAARDHTAAETDNPSHQHYEHGPLGVLLITCMYVRREFGVARYAVGAYQIASRCSCFLGGMGSPSEGGEDAENGVAASHNRGGLGSRPGCGVAGRWGADLGALVAAMSARWPRWCDWHRRRPPAGRSGIAYDETVELDELVLAAAGGDHGAWSALVERFAGMIWAIARSQGLAPIDAADVSQTTWLRFAEHIARLRDPAQAGSWLATTARREAMRVSRLGARSVLVDPWQELDQVSESREPRDMSMERERALAVHEAVAELPERCRRLLLALVEDPPVGYAALSERFGVSIGSIGPTRARCIDRLRTLLRETQASWSPQSLVPESSP
jgi:RNA polymerase sigma factor (sigma-70 family)